MRVSTVTFDLQLKYSEDYFRISYYRAKIILLVLSRLIFRLTYRLRSQEIVQWQRGT